MFHTRCTSYDQFLANPVYGGLVGEWIFLFWRKTCQIKFIIHGHVHPNSPKNMPSNITKSCWTSLVVLYSQNYVPGWDMRALPWIFSLFRIHKKIPTQTNQLAKFSYPKKSGNKKFQTPNNSPITPITRNLEYPQGVVPSLFFKTRQSTKPLKWE